MYLKAKHGMQKNSDYFFPIYVNSIKKVFSTARMPGSVLGSVRQSQHNKEGGTGPSNGFETVLGRCSKGA